MTWRIRRAVATGLPSSLTATIPASFIAAISARASPLLPTEAAPMGQTWTGPAVAARSTMERVTEALSFTGWVFGMQHTAVKPPRAADCVPVSMVSDISWPGSRKWQWRSMKPGATIIPFASKISAPGAERFAPVFEMRSPSSKISSAASVSLAGSRTRPFLIRSIRAILCGMRRVRSSAADQMVEQGHAYREAIGNLLEHAGLRPIGYGGVDFQAAHDRAGMQDERVRPREAQARGSELIARDIFIGSERRLVNAFGLHAQNHHDIRVVEGFVNPMDHAHVGRELFEFARNPHGGAAERDSHTEFAEQVNIRARHTAVENVAEDGDVPTLEFSL